VFAAESLAMATRHAGGNEPIIGSPAATDLDARQPSRWCRAAGCHG
jgi:hypothetical protein